MVSATTAPIVCGIDFSPESRRAIRTGAALAAQLDCPLHVVSAVEPLIAEAARLRHQLPAFLAHVERDLHDFARPLALPDGRLACHASAGEPAAVLMAYARDTHARLIMVGTRGRGQAARLFLGSTTLRLLRHTDRPVLVTDADDPADPPDVPAGGLVSRIVCGVDFSGGSLAAVTAAARLATDLGAELTLVHAVPPADVPVGWDSLARGVETDRVDQATAQLNALLRAHGIAATVRAAVGSPADVLNAEIDADPRTLVAVGLQGSARHRPGSTALRILAVTRVPVLAVPE